MLFQRTLSVEENTKHWPQRLSDESTLQPPHPFKLKSGHCIAPFRENSPLKRSEWHMLTRDHSVLPATHTFIHEWNEPSCLHLPAAAHHRTLAGTYFPSHKAYDAELACVASYIPRWYARHKTVTHSSTNRPIVRRPGIELQTIESQVRRTRPTSHLSYSTNFILGKERPSTYDRQLSDGFRS